VLHHVLWCDSPLSLRGISEQRRVLTFAASSWLQAFRSESHCSKYSLQFAARAVGRMHGGRQAAMQPVSS